MDKDYVPFRNHIDKIELPDNMTLKELADLLGDVTPIKTESLTQEEIDKFNEYYLQNNIKYQPINNQTLSQVREGLFDKKQYCRTLEELFEKYPNLDNPKESGVEFYQFVEPSNKSFDDLIVITTSDLGLEPGDYTWSGYEQGDANPGDYLLHFPYYARTLIFDSVESIDKHLQENHGQFKLPGYF